MQIPKYERIYMEDLTPWEIDIEQEAKVSSLENLMRREIPIQEAIDIVWNYCPYEPNFPGTI